MRLRAISPGQEVPAVQDTSVPAGEATDEPGKPGDAAHPARKGGVDWRPLLLQCRVSAPSAAAY